MNKESKMEIYLKRGINLCVIILLRMDGFG